MTRPRDRAGTFSVALLAGIVAVVAVAALGWLLTRPGGDELASFAAPDGAVVRTIAVSPDGRTIAAATGDGSVRLFDADRGREVARLSGHGKGTTAVAFAPDGLTLASGSLDRAVKVWDLATGECRATLTGFEGPIRSLAFSPDGKTLAAGECRKVRLWAVGSAPDKLRTLSAHKTDIIGIAFRDGGRTFASVGCDKTVRYWEVATGKPVGQFAFASGAKGGHLKGFSATADGSLAVATLQGQVIVLDLDARAERDPVAPRAGVLHGAAVTPDGNRIVLSSEGRGLLVWNTSANAELADLKGHATFASAIAAMPDGQRAVTGGTDGNIKIWPIAD